MWEFNAIKHVWFEYCMNDLWVFYFKVAKLEALHTFFQIIATSCQNKGQKEDGSWILEKCSKSILQGGWERAFIKCKGNDMDP
jgi:hypothetical protein